jgi:hypothetical protein
MRWGFSANVHPTSIASPSWSMPTVEAHDASTEYVQTASELPSMWKGEYVVSAVGASIVIGPGTPSSRIESSDARMIFIAPPYRRAVAAG